MSEDDDMEQLREERIEELREQAEQQQPDEEAQQEAQQQAEAQKQALLRKFLTSEARQRLSSVRMSRPDFADQVEQQLIAIGRSGRINGKIDDDQMRELLKEMKPESTSYDIKRR